MKKQLSLDLQQDIYMIQCKCMKNETSLNPLEEKECPRCGGVMKKVKDVWALPF